MTPNYKALGIEFRTIWLATNSLNFILAEYLNTFNWDYISPIHPFSKHWDQWLLIKMA